MVNDDRPEVATRLGVWSAWTVFVVGIAYVAVIGLWLAVDRAPREPIPDPYLLAMEALTIASAFGILGLVVALSVVLSPARPVHARFILALGSLAAALTMTVHFVQLTAVRQLWHAGRLAGYKLVWPSMLFAAEYFAWDILVGLTMLSAGFALSHLPRGSHARQALLLGGALCVLGVAGPVSGRLAWQNVAVVGYAVVLPIASVLLAGFLRGSSPNNDAA